MYQWWEGWKGTKGRLMDAEIKWHNKSYCDRDKSKDEARGNNKKPEERAKEGGVGVLLSWCSNTPFYRSGVKSLQYVYVNSCVCVLHSIFHLNGPLSDLTPCKFVTDINKARGACLVCSLTYSTPVWIASIHQEMNTGSFILEDSLFFCVKALHRCSLNMHWFCCLFFLHHPPGITEL